MHTFARHSSYGGLAASWQKTSIKIPGSSELPAGVPPPPASEWDWKKPDWELLKVPGWEVTYRNKPKACKAAADAAGSGARPPGSLVDAHIGRQHKHNNGEKYRYHLQGLKTWVRRYRLFKKSLRKRTDDRSRFDHKHDEDESLDDDFGEDDDYGAITTNRSYQRRCFLSDGSFAFRDGQCRVKRYRLFKKSLRKRNLWPKMSSQEVAAYVAAAVAAAGAIVRVLRGRRGKIYDKYP